MHVFQLVSAIKPKPVDKIKQNTYSVCFILHVNQAQKKLTILSAFSRGKIQGGDGVC